MSAVMDMTTHRLLRELAEKQDKTNSLLAEILEQLKASNTDHSLEHGF